MPRSTLSALVAAGLLAATATGCAAQAPTAGASAGVPTVTCNYPADGAAAKPVSAPPAAEPESGTVSVTLEMNGAPLRMALDRAKTPCTVGSFVHLAQAGYFDGTSCHRLTASATLKVLQCGDPTGSGGGGPGYSFADETTPDMTYPKGTVAMANAGPDTNGSQFFLVYGDSSLPPSYTVFGTITDGAILQSIAAAGVQGGGEDGAPASAVTINKVSITTS